MPTDAIVALEQLRCITLKNTEARTEPYIWPVLVRIDDNTLATPELVTIDAPVLGNARIVIKDSMRAGDTAAIPGSVGMVRARFEDNLTTRRLVLVVALLEMDETPKSAMQAGFQAFSSELRAAIAENLFALSAADEEEEKRITEAIKKRVESRVRSATESGLSSWEKAKVVAGILNLDDAAGSASVSFGKDFLVSTPIALAFESKARFFGIESVTKYEIQGQLQVRPVLTDRCQVQVEAVNAAQAVVDGIEKEISNLQAQLRGEGDEPPLPKSYINDEIERLRDEELGPAMDELQAARAALQFCRDRLGVAVDPRGGGVATA